MRPRVADGRIELGRVEWRFDVGDLPFPGKGQDAWRVGAHSAVVADGATPLSPDWPQDVREFAEAAASAFVDAAELMQSASDESIWTQALLELGGMFAPAGYRRSAGLTLVRSVGTTVRFSTVGDVLTIVDSVEGVFDLMSQDLPRLDTVAGESGNDLDTLISNRKLANVEGGYAIISDDPQTAFRTDQLSVEARGIKAFWMMSDGFWRHLPDDPGAAVEVLSSFDSVEELVKSLRLEDPDVALDDATLLRFTPA